MGSHKFRTELVELRGLLGSVVFGLFICFIGLVVASISERVLFHEGSNWFVKIDAFGVIAYDRERFRIADTLQQLPSLFIIWLSGGKGGDWIWASHVVGGLTYYLHPFLSLLVTFKLFESKDLKRFWHYPILSFVFAVMPVLGFALSCIPLGISAFWPAFAIVISNKNRPIDLFIFTTCIGIMVFDHESLVLLNLFLMVAVAISAHQSRVYFLSCLGAAALLTLYIVTFVKSGPGGFDYALLYLSTVKPNYLYFVVAGTFSFFLLILAGWFRKSRVRDFLSIVIVGGSFIYLGKVLTQFPPEGVLEFSKEFRALISPIAVFFATLLLIEKRSENFLFPSNEKIELTLLAALVVVGIQDWRSTIQWKVITNSIRKQLSEIHGSCLEIPKSSLNAKVFGYDPVFLAPTSIALQHSNRPSKVLGQTSYRDKNWDFCNEIRKGRIFYVHSYPLPDGPYMKFDLLRRGADDFSQAAN